MLKAVAFGIACGAGFQAWRNYPADGPATAASLWWLLVAATVCAYLGGRWHGRGRGGATAVAVASAEATAAAQAVNRVQVFNVMPGGGAAPSGVRMPTESAPWLTGDPAPVLDVDQIDGMDLHELVETADLQEGRP